MIRKISSADAADIQVINEKGFGYAYPLDDCKKQLTAILNNPNHILIG